MPSYTGTCVQNPCTDEPLIPHVIRDQIRENVLVKQYYCDVDIAHLISYNEELAHKLQTQPADTIPLVHALQLSFEAEL